MAERVPTYAAVLPAASHRSSCSGSRFPFGVLNDDSGGYGLHSRSMANRVIFGTLCMAAFAAAPFAQKPTLLVVNQGDSTVGIVDPEKSRQIAVIAENISGMHGHEIAVSPDGRTAYLPIYGSSGVGKPGLSGSSMLVLDVPSRKFTGKVDFGHEVRPHLPVLDAARGLLYVTTELDNSVTIVDTTTLKIIGTIPTGQPESHMLALSRDGRFGYTANVGPGTVSVLDMLGRKTIALIPVAKPVQRIAMSVDDKLVFTADQSRPRLAVIDTATNMLKTWVALPGSGYGTAPTQDGRWLLVAVPGKDLVAVVDIEALKVVKTISVPATPQEVLLRPAGDIAYVSCNQSGQVAAIVTKGDPSHWAVQSLIAAGPFADGLGWAK